MFAISVFAVLQIFAGAQKEKPAKPDQQLVVGVLPDVDSIPIIVASEKGFFVEEGLNAKLEYFKSPVDRDSAFQSGNLDGVISDVLAAAFAKEGGFDVKITSLTNGSYKLLLSPLSKAESIADLKGKDIGISKNTIIEYTTDRILETAGIAEADVKKVAIPKIPVRLEMLLNGKIEAATLPEPLATNAIQNGARLLNSSDVLGINPGVLLFRGESIGKKKTEIEAFYRAYNKAVSYVMKTPVEEYANILVEKAGFPEQGKDSIKLPRYTNASLPPEEEIRGVMAWLLGRGLIKTAYAFQDLVYTGFIR